MVDFLVFKVLNEMQIDALIYTDLVHGSVCLHPSTLRDHIELFCKITSLPMSGLSRCVEKLSMFYFLL